MLEPLPPTEYHVEFTDGPFAGRRGAVTCRPPVPIALYVLPDGGIVSPDLIAAGNPGAHALCQQARLYLEGISPRGGPYRYFAYRD